MHEKGAVDRVRAKLREECEFVFEGVELDPRQIYHMTITLYGAWRKPDGQPDSHLPDTLNLAKVVEDEIQRALNLNDRHNFEYDIKKKKGEWGCWIVIHALTEMEYEASSG